MEINFSKLEEKILRFWKENRVFEKSIERRKEAPNFVFYEGPPTINAKPGFHHVFSRVFKDIICRYKTMQGFKVLRKAGWDTHGLPVELEIEKKLGFKSKKEIEKYGIAKFNKKCKKAVWQYKKDWEKLTERIGFWLDMENPYITCQPDYIETVWWILKEIYQKGLLYQDYKVSPYCPRCQTVLSGHEIAQGYEKVKEPAIYVKFKILNKPKTYFLVWTTTPWTLPGNVAIAINPKFTYVKVETNNEYLILAKERLKICGIEGKIVQEFRGDELLDISYQPLFTYIQPEKKAFYIVAGNFVSLDEGTGLVHVAPAFGEEDFVLAKKNNLPILLTVDEQGKFKSIIKDWANLFVKEADPKIIENLKKRGLLLKEELYLHDYPFCWRCHSPLLYYAKSSWFIRTKKVKENLIKNNQKINWIPKHLKRGRFGEWLSEVKDWAISRERYWGTPLPVWFCQAGKGETLNSKSKINPKSKITNSEQCEHVEVIGSLEDLLKQKFSTNNYYLFRHGHSLRQVKNLASCWPEKEKCPLTEQGKKEVFKQAQKLKTKKIELIFSSDLLRAKKTAQIVSQQTGAKVIFDKRLREFDVGIFNGQNAKLTWQYFKKRKNYWQVKIPQGESLVDIKKRMYCFLREIDKQYQNKNILIVSHELPLTVLEETLKGLSLKNILELRRKKKIKRIETGEFRKVEFKDLPFNEKMELDFHRPYIDKIKFYCHHCGGLMKRVPEVIDCWFDSGSMPFAQEHWPFTQSQKYLPPELFPADYIAEAIDQTRGWFYTLLAISTLLGFGPPYKNVISLGHVVDERGEKMSKSKGNIVNPWNIIGKYGADSIRWYFYTINQPSDSKSFLEKDVENSLRKFILTFWNCFQFYETYASKGKSQKSKGKSQKLKVKSQNILDRWIISRLNELIQETTKKLDKYDVTGAAREIENFVINDLSLWYIRRSRRRFQRPKAKKELEEASQTLAYLLLVLSKLTAPFLPFLAEEIYQKIKSIVDIGHLQNLQEVNSQQPKFKSIHLDDWPRANKKLIDEKLEKKMKKIREIVALALAERARAAIKIRQPLSKLKIKNQKLKIKNEFLDLIKEEVNVKEIVFDSKLEKAVELDTKITPELKEEGIIREVIRQIQEMRKALNLEPKDKILVQYSASPALNIVLKNNKNVIIEEGKVNRFQPEGKGTFDLKKTIKVDNDNLYLTIKKL